MQKQYWAQRGRQKSGPHESREAAVAAFRAAFPDKKGKPHARQIMTGYGTFGPYFDIQWEPRQ